MKEGTSQAFMRGGWIAIRVVNSWTDLQDQI